MINENIRNARKAKGISQEEMAVKNQEENLYLQAEKKRGLILLLSFIAMLTAMSIKNELISIILTGGCVLAALIILYRNLALLTRITTVNLKTGTLKITTIFNIAILIFTIIIIALDLRLPWTVQDEDTWNVAHKIVGDISLPLVLLYLAAFCTISNFEAVTITIMLLWIGIPGLLSFAFWWRKYHGRL